ncbi:MAG: DHH family phosphoesterase [Candidatus Nomurabacteria bacterium]|jgi:phosphoesterase RecJ-like protein|nr:DHH family phosphoesterase [Candidatus Nomurabacteria bacterium]
MSKILEFAKQYERVIIIQAENPDADSLGSALALEGALPNREVSLYCPVQIPKYLRYLQGWGRVSDEFDFRAEAAIIVDTAAKILLSKLLEKPEIASFLQNRPILVIDHHETEPDLPFDFTGLIAATESTTKLIFDDLVDGNDRITPEVAQNLLAGLMSDTLGLTTANVGAETYRTAAGLLDLGADINKLEQDRHELMKKSQKILRYKAELIQRVEYHLGGRLATVLIPFEEIREYSDEYNPNVLILDELRLVEGVEVAIALKTYPDGKLTGKLRASKPVAEELAAAFGGGGHAYAAGFRIYEDYAAFLPELIAKTDELLERTK